MTSVVIAAHNEEAVIGACLKALHPGSGGAPEVIVVANGCTDDTASVARSYPGVVVLELEQGSKALALNAGDSEARSFPRIYLDADIVVPEGCVDGLAEALAKSGNLAAVPDRRMDTVGRPWPVRAYFAINERLPVFRDGLFGRGMIALSEEGRSRFEVFPLMVADDLFLDSLFESSEKAHLSAFVVCVEAPARTRDLARRLVRVRRGNAAMRQAGSTGAVKAKVRRADRWAWLRDVVVPNPRLAPAAIVYVILTAYAAVVARLTSSRSLDWGKARRHPRSAPAESSPSDQASVRGHRPPT